jgi:hypothetical protein
MAVGGILESLISLSIVTSGALLSTAVVDSMNAIESNTQAKRHASSVMTDRIVQINTLSTHELDDICSQSIAGDSSEQLLALQLNTWKTQGTLEVRTRFQSCESLVGGNLTRAKLVTEVRAPQSSQILYTKTQEARFLR